MARPLHPGKRRGGVSPGARHGVRRCGDPKGANPAVDSYSAFFENDRKTTTGLAGLLREHGCDDLTMVGLATDYCVAWSALDGVKSGFRVEVRLPACRAIDLDGSLDRALADLRAAGVVLTASSRRDP